MIIRLLFLSLMVFSCSSTQENLISSIFSGIKFNEYKKYTWQQKVQYFESKDNQKIGAEEEKIFKDALSDDYDSVTLAALTYAFRVKLKRYKKNYLDVALNHYNTRIQLEAMSIFDQIPLESPDLAVFVQLTDEHDWLVKEKAFQLIRRFPSEKKKKKYHKVILSRLDEMNPHVLRQVFKTLKWYGRSQAFKPLYDRSLYYDDTLEFIFMIRELGSYRNRKMFRRLKRLAKDHPNFLVREEAKKLLKKRKK